MFEPQPRKNQRKVKYNKRSDWTNKRGRFVDGKRLCLDCPQDISDRHGKAERCFECAGKRHRKQQEEHRVKNPVSDEKMREYRKRHVNRLVIDQRKNINECIICGEPIDDRGANAKYCRKHSNVMSVAFSRDAARKRREKANGYDK